MRAIVTLLLVTVSASPARADVVQFGVGAFQSAAFAFGGRDETATWAPGPTDLRLRLRLLDVVGAELAVGSPDLVGSQPLDLDRIDALLSGLPFLASGSYASVYLRGGVGTSGVLATIRGEQGFDTIHVGLGLELYVTDFLAIVAEVDAEANIATAQRAVADLADPLVGLRSSAQIHASAAFGS